LHVRWLLLALLAVSGPVAGLSVDVDAPREAPSSPAAVPVQVTVANATQPVEVKAWLGGGDWQASRTFNGSAFQRSDFYALEFDPDPDGHLSEQVWVRANPDSANADRLSGPVQVGVRARTSADSAQASAPVDLVEGSELAIAGAGQPVHVVDETGQAVFAGGLPTRSAIVDVPLESGREVCDRECGVDRAWGFARFGNGRALVEHEGTGEASARLVLAFEGQACPLAVDGERARVDLEALADGSRCREVRERGSLARLFHRGRLVASLPDRPGFGQVVEDPAGGVAPWRLPGNASPREVEFREVTGQARAFATRTDGLAMFERAVDRARERIVASTYVLTNEQAVDALAGAARRGLDVHLYLEPDPVGALPDRTPGLVERLERAGGTVHWHEGPSQRSLQHAKVLVVDGGLVLVFTENFTNHGLPADGEGNLGFGLGVANVSLARRVESVFREPVASRAMEPDGWEPLSASVALLKSPENAWRVSGVPAWIEEDPGPIKGLALSASPRWGPRENPWLSAMVNASRDHPVELVFSGQPEPAAVDNRQAAAHVLSDPRGEAIDARVARPGLGTVHAKAVVGGEGVLVGSSNWGLGGALTNREVNLLVRDSGLAERFAALAERELTQAEDWSPVGAPGLGSLAASVAALAVGFTRRWR
jgi:hypothetical protein